ncbi:deoxyribodipyrimidine photo-lyase [Limibacter armeniacum]|uniref:cryptochrome/photolyase family protein n=1 Tax=Limibacter armeniacum TaxID=466084 RepID=UPI002FE59572
MSVSVFWFRRDLRLEDNAGLYHALKGEHPVLPLFIFDKEILDNLEDKDDKRLTFIHQEVERIKAKLEKEGSSLLVKYGKPADVWAEVLNEYDVKAVFTNRDYEPYAKERDATIGEYLSSEEIPFKTFKDQCIFEMDEVLKDDGDPYVVFTPYSRKWKEKLNVEKSDFYVKSYPVEKYADNYFQTKPLSLISLEDMGFEPVKMRFPSRTVDTETLEEYKENRDYPAVDGTSRLSIHLRFGTISIRQLARQTIGKSDTFLNELIWRDFYMMILHHFPKVVTENFHSKYDALNWRNNEKEFEAWCEGKTGYPIVDAGMRQLNETGYMHNRVRMITASFLTKHLLIDWRWGEAYFARKLLDYDLSANNGGWQWAASTGTDAQPYFRIFNPYSQQDKFDKQEAYIKKWVPEFGTGKYPEPIVEHKEARQRALDAFKSVMEN